MIGKKRHLKSYNNGTESPGFIGFPSDKLSEVLDGHATALDDSLKHQESLLRRELMEGFSLYKDSRINLGKALHGLRAIYRAKQIWTLLAEDLGNVIGRDKRTIFRLIVEYERSLMPHREETELMLREEETDPNEEGDEGALSKQDEQFLKAFLQVQKAVSTYPKVQKVPVLLEVIQRMGFELGMTAQSFHLEPRAPWILIRDDGQEHFSAVTHLNAAQIIPWPNEAPANDLVE